MPKRMPETERVRGPLRVYAIGVSGLMCPYCGEALLRPAEVTVDHVVPRSRGGAIRDPRNIVAAHQSCNSRKGSRLPAEAFGEETARRVAEQLSHITLEGELWDTARAISAATRAGREMGKIISLWLDYFANKESGYESIYAG